MTRSRRLIEEGNGLVRYHHGIGFVGVFSSSSLILSHVLLSALHRWGAESDLNSTVGTVQRVTCIGLHYASDAQMLILRGANALDSERIGHLDSLGTGPF